MNPALIAGGIQLGTTLLGKALGGDKKTEAAIPKDLAPMRAQQISLLNYLLGMGPDPRTQIQGQAQQQVQQGQQLVQQLQGGKGKGKFRDFKNQAAQQIQQALPAIQQTAAQSWMPTQAVQQQPIPAFTPFGRHMAQGGMVSGPGGPTSDQVPAMLSNGEGVLNTGAVQQLGGPDIIHLLNALGMAQHMAGGGIAGQPMVEPQPLGQTGTRPNNVQEALGQLQSGYNMTGTMPQMSQPQVQPQTTQWGGQMPVTMGQMGQNPIPGLPPLPNVSGMGTGGGEVPTQGGGVMTPQQRLESFYGPLSPQVSPLQQQGSQAFNYLLNNPTPEQRAAEITLPQLQQNLSGNASTQGAINNLMGLQSGAGADVEGRLSQIGQGPITGTSQMDAILQQLGGAGGGFNFSGSGLGIPELQRLAGANPGEAVMAALNPVFQRNLATANQTGGRFGTSNALLRDRALEDFNLQSANALQRGVDQQITAASNLGNVGTSQDDLRLRGLLGGQQNQLGALQALITGTNNRDNSALTANQVLGNQRLQAQQQTGTNLTNAGQLGAQQGQLGNSAANILAQILGGQGAAERGLAGQAFGAGAVETGQNQASQNQVVQLLQQLLGKAQSATLGGPVSQTPSGAQQGADIGSSLAQLYLQGLKTQTGGK